MGKQIKRLMIGPKGNSEFCFPQNLSVPQGEAKWDNEGQGETKLTVFCEASH